MEIKQIQRVALSHIKQFKNHQYMTIETFRKNRQGVKTPVWFAQDGNTLHVWTEISSGKAKRIRNNGNVQIAPSTASGEPLGEWITALATTKDADANVNYTETLFKKKYGLLFRVLSRFNKWRGRKYTSVEILLD